MPCSIVKVRFEKRSALRHRDRTGPRTRPSTVSSVIREMTIERSRFDVRSSIGNREPIRYLLWSGVLR